MARRKLSVFSLSFLDIMSCGFGAVILIFLIINHATEQEQQRRTEDLSADVALMNRNITIGEKNLAQLREEIDRLDTSLAETKDQAQLATQTIRVTGAELNKLDAQSLAKNEDLNELKSDVEKLEEETERLKSERVDDDPEGNAIRSFTGLGDRQYLTGLKVGGERILIALDTSASMLDETLINIIRRRNMEHAAQKQAPKWQRAVRTVDWITTQIPLQSQFHIVTFNEQPNDILKSQQAGSQPSAKPGKHWYDLAGGRDLNKAIDELNDMAPSGGTSLHNLFTYMASLQPAPDNVFLITDGLPTQGEKPSRRSTVNGRDRQRYFQKALEEAPVGIPFNVILMPMEGDPLASPAFWQLAQATGGSFLTPSRDWP